MAYQRWQLNAFGNRSRNNNWNNNRQGRGPSQNGCNQRGNGCGGGRIEPPCNNLPVCRPCFNEADYAVEVIERLFEEYCEVEKKADIFFGNALAKLNEAIDCIHKGLECNKEGYIIWVKIEAWLNRYYERFGVYQGCPEKMEEIRACVALLLLHERASLELAIDSCKHLQESRTIDEQMHALRRSFKECCIPKC